MRIRGRGRTEVARVEKCEAVFYSPGVKHRIVRVLLSDGAIATKEVESGTNSLGVKIYRETMSWHRSGTILYFSLDEEGRRKVALEWIQEQESKGFKLTRKQTVPEPEPAQGDDSGELLAEFKGSPSAEPTEVPEEES